MVVLALALAGCNNLKDMFSARPETAAEASGQQLKVERLAKMMTSIKGVPLTREASSVRIASLNPSPSSPRRSRVARCSPTPAWRRR
jgi:hypothetical protein